MCKPANTDRNDYPRALQNPKSYELHQKRKLYDKHTNGLFIDVMGLMKYKKKKWKFLNSCQTFKSFSMELARDVRCCNPGVRRTYFRFIYFIWLDRNGTLAISGVFLYTLDLLITIDYQG